MEVHQRRGGIPLQNSPLLIHSREFHCESLAAIHFESSSWILRGGLHQEATRVREEHVTEDASTHLPINHSMITSKIN